MNSNDMSDSKKQQKKLYIFAHRGEAQAWFDQIHFIKIPFIFDGLWQSEDSFLLICDEGIQNATEKLAICLAQFESRVSEILNYGIVGKLDQKLELEKIYPIRNVYHYAHDEAQYKSFQISSNGIDCISSYERVTQKYQADELKNFAHVVDRELWAICRVAQIFKKRVFSFKLISDDSGLSEKIDCQLIQENALHFSSQLYHYDQNRIEKFEKFHTKEYLLPKHIQDYFYFTRSMDQQFQAMMHKLTQKNISQDQLWNEIDLEKLIHLKLKPKDRTLFLIEKLNEKLNPFNSMLKQKLKILTQPFEDKHIVIQFAKDHEDSSIGIQFKINSEDNLKLQLENLQTFPVQQIQAVLSGDWDV